MARPLNLALKKPAYSMSRRAFWLSFWLAWSVIVALAVGALTGSDQAVSFGTFTVPSAFMLIAALLGIHRAYGSADMRTLAEVSTEEKLEA